MIKATEKILHRITSMKRIFWNWDGDGDSRKQIGYKSVGFCGRFSVTGAVMSLITFMRTLQKVPSTRLDRKFSK